ncbi:DUF397 domain-containing protein [Streptomyces koelreuteriae]|uniref:DUF397 domain-containing protein n=1 Tax=Streptomyces koelreuteriae TaxID=2838015 RepID=UPI003EBC56B1
MERDAQWRRSSYSGTSGGECVEVADLGVLGAAVRDSKNPDAGILTVSSEAYSVFVAASKARSE